MPTFVDILTFVNMINVMLIRVEHENVLEHRIQAEHSLRVFPFPASVSLPKKNKKTCDS